MAFFDGINKQLSSAKQGAQRAAELSRIQRRIHSMMQEVEKVYSQIGKSYYATLRKGDANLDALQQMCAMVETLERDIAALLKQTDELKQLQRCPQCGHTQNLQSKFCASCGFKFADDAAFVETNDDADVSEAPESGERDDPAEGSGSVFVNWPQGSPPEAEDEPGDKTEDN